MSISWKKVGIGLAIGLTMMWVHPLLPADQGWLVSAQAQQGGDEERSPFAFGQHEEDEEKESLQREDPRIMTQGEWLALAQQVAMNLHWIGMQMGVSPEVRAIYVPALTQEYLQAFQLSLMQGAIKQQADILATQYIFARIQQLAAQAGPGSQGDDGCVSGRHGGSFCSGSDGFMSFSPPPGSGSPGISIGP